jgi:protein-S-isoprenylcysteine O-methyltransferase Ste14
MLFPAAAVPFPGDRVAAIVALVLGLGCLFGSALQFRLERTTLDPRTPGNARRFVVTGLYLFSRNPMYLGMALLLLGAAAWTSNAIGYLLFGLFCIYLTEFQIKPEERALEKLFGADFMEYKARVRRWI